MRPGYLGLAIVVLLLSGTMEVRAQDRPLLDDLRDGGSIVSEEVVRLSFDGLDVAPDALARVFPLPGGGWGVSSNVFGGSIQMFDRDARPSGSLGRAGEGPGEFGGQVFGLTVDGQLWVVDPNNARLTAYSEELEIEGERRLPGRVFSVAPSLEGPGVLISGFLQNGSESHGVARIALNEEGDVFGGHLADHPNPRVQIHMPAEVPAGEIWTVAVAGGAVNILDSSGLGSREMLQLPDEDLRVVADEGLRRGEDGGMPRPPPHLSGIMGDESGYVWVLYGVADQDWTPQVGPEDGIHRMLDTRLLVIDPDRRAIVGQDILDQLCMPMAGRRLSCVDEPGESIRILEMAVADSRAD